MKTKNSDAIVFTMFVSTLKYKAGVFKFSGLKSGFEKLGLSDGLV